MLLELAPFCATVGEGVKMTDLASNVELYRAWVATWVPTLISLLAEFPSLAPPLELLFEHLPAARPRLYSISSHPARAAKPRGVDLTVGLVSFAPPGDTAALRRGLCSHALAREQALHCYIVPAPRFRLPADRRVPCLLVAAGTGIAPMRGFWQDNAQQLQLHPQQPPRPLVLLFGARDAEHELYHDEIARALETGALSAYRPCYSRKPGAPREYVQDAIRAMKDVVGDLLTRNNAHVFVCGNVTMARGVEDALCAVLEEREGISLVAAKRWVETAREDGRYREDVFGLTSHFDSEQRKQSTMKPAQDFAYRSLHQHLGQEALERAAEDWFARVTADELLRDTFSARRVDENGLKRHIAQAFAFVAGGPSELDLERLASVHADMDLNDAHFDRMLHHMLAAMQAAGADPLDDIPNLRRNIDALRPDVIGTQAPPNTSPLPLLGVKIIESPRASPASKRSSFASPPSP
jgi:ferredoxin-NADP reductase/truncated hemoglobin YjbI